MDGEREAHLIALACSTPPEGRGRWTLRLLADRMVELRYVDSMSHETVRRALKEERAPAASAHDLAQARLCLWCIPPKHSAEFVWHVEPRGSPDMEDVLEVYHRPYDPRRPVVCLDETFKQLVGEAREPLPARPGAVERYDHVYTRLGVASLAPRLRAAGRVAARRHHRSAPPQRLGARRP